MGGSATAPNDVESTGEPLERLPALVTPSGSALRPKLFTARALLPDPTTLLEGGGVLVVAGRVEGVLGSPGEVRRAVDRFGAEVIDLEGCVLTPGLVNAHAHLDLTSLAGKVPGDGGLVPWISALLRERAKLRPADLRASWLAGATRLRATGSTTVADIDSTGAVVAHLPTLPLRTWIFREVLDAGDLARAKAALESIEQRLPSAPRAMEGLAPHAPHTVSDALLAGCARVARDAELPVTIHWAETPEEEEWLLRGTGSFSKLLGASPRCRGMERLERASFDGVRLSLVHANCVGDSDLERAAALGATLVHCPGTHAFFAREPAPLDAWLDHGLSVALGTDSFASNADLDLRREMALLRAQRSDLSPELVFDWATRGGARALGMAGRIGEVCVGAQADLSAFHVDESGRVAILEALTAGTPPVHSTWIGGESG